MRGMKKLFLLLVGALLGVALLPYVLFRQASLPEGTSLSSPGFTYSQAKLLVDRTAWDGEAQAYLREHQVFDAILDEIAGAETFIVADFFLWNPWTGAIEAGGRLRSLANELADALIAKRVQNPNLPILVVTDPINRIYGDLAPVLYDRLAAAGIPVVFTDLGRLPDSNKIYAPQVWFWKKFIKGDFGVEGRALPNPFNPDGKSLTLEQFSRLLYFKANHRKVLVTGRRSGPRAIVASFNPADGSANHSNLGLLVDGAVAAYAARSEMAVAGWSAENPANVHGGLTAEVEAVLRQLQVLVPVPALADEAPQGRASVAWRSEGAIRDELVAQLDAAGPGSRIDAAVFYFSERRVVDALKAALERGASLRLLLDANRDAFGREKNGVPNRPLAAELMRLAQTGGQVAVRWAATHGEQFHSKVLRIVGPDQDILLLGSANWTRRNIGDLNLEADLLLDQAGAVGRTFDSYFESLWGNRRGLEESLPYEAWSEEGWELRWKTWLYRFQEWSGASTF